MTPENEADLAALAGIGALFLEACELVEDGRFSLSHWTHTDKWRVTIQWKREDEEIETKLDAKTPQLALDAAVLRMKALKVGV